VRAAIVAEGERMNARWVRRILGGPVVVALDGAGGPDGNRLADYAAALGARTGELLSSGPEAVVSRAALVAALRDLTPPDGARPLPDAALAELAASLCPLAAVNNRLELYRRRLAAAEALHATRRAFIAAQRVTPAELIAKVAARFPAAEPLPDRPELDRLVAGAGLDLHWQPGEGAYLAPVPAASDGSSGTMLTRHSTGSPPVNVAPVEIDVAADFEDRLLRSVGSGGLLVLVTRMRLLERSATELARMPVTVVDFDERLLAELHRLTESGKPSWELIVEVDAAGPTSARWQNLQRLLDRALDAFTASLAATSGTVLLTHCGLLARYNRLDVVARWRDVVHDSATALEALWLLVSSPATSDVPMLDGEAVPVLTRNEWTRIPDDWLRNAHAVARAR
jgi:hypothetical protein